jgi:hypothetical protein
MFYRSDWPERGLSAPLSDADFRDDSPAWQVDGNSGWCWVSKPDDFESRLYGLPIWNLHLELWDSGDGWLAAGLNSTRLSRRLEEMRPSLPTSVTESGNRSLRYAMKASSGDTADILPTVFYCSGHQV